MKTNDVRVPVVRANGELEMLPYGHDAETGVMTLDPFKEGSQMYPSGVVAVEFFGESGKEKDCDAPGLGAFKGLFHVLLPLFILSQIDPQGASHCHQGFPFIYREVQNVQGLGYELGIGFHAALQQAEASSQEAEEVAK